MRGLVGGSHVSVGHTTVRAGQRRWIRWCVEPAAAAVAREARGWRAMILVVVLLLVECHLADEKNKNGY